MKLVSKNITLENVKKSNYWDLISILVWNHYSEKKYQEESNIEIKELWCGIGNGGSSHSDKWSDSSYTEEGYKRTLQAIVITFKRSDYMTYIYINTHGNIDCIGSYVNDINRAGPKYYTPNLKITNWMISNGFIEIIE